MTEGRRQKAESRKQKDNKEEKLFFSWFRGLPSAFCFLPSRYKDLRFRLTFKRWYWGNRIRTYQIRLPIKRRGYASGGLHEKMGALHDLAQAGQIAIMAAGITLSAIFPPAAPFIMIGAGIASAGLGMALSKKPKTKDTVQANGHLINTRMASDPLPVSYGETKIKGTWVFCRPSGTDNEYLDIVVTWGEGEFDGISDTIETSPIFTGSGLDDLETGGTFTPGDGPNLIANSTFQGTYYYDDLAGWDQAPFMSGYWTFATGSVTHVTGNTEVLTETGLSEISEPVVGKAYELVFTVSGRTAGTIVASVGGDAGTSRNADGTYTEAFTAASTAALVFTPDTDFDGTISAVYFYETDCPWNQWVVEIDHVNLHGAGTHDSFRWSRSGLEHGWDAEDVEITGAAQNLANGVTVTFAAITGHTVGNRWNFYSGEGLFLGDRLKHYYEGHSYPWETPQEAFIAYRRLVWDYFHAGTAQQTVDTVLQANHPTWNEALRNTAYSYIRLKYAEDAWRSIPEFRLLAKTKKVYDPRTGLVAYSNNPALAWRDFLQSNRYSIGIPVGSIDDAFVHASADVCDAEGITFDGSIIDQREFAEHLDSIMACFRAFFLWSEGTYKLKTHTDDAAVMTLTDADIEIGPDSFTIALPGIPETPNKCVVQYINPDNSWGYEEAHYGDSQVLSDIDARIVELTLPGIKDIEVATQLAKFYYLRARENMEITLLCNLRTYALEPGDMVQVTHEYTGWTNHKLRVKTIGLPQHDLIPITFMEEDSTIYDDTVDVQARSRYHVAHETFTATVPTTLATSTGADEQTENKKDAYVEFSWDYIDFGYNYTLKYRGTSGSAWKPWHIVEVNDPMTGPGNKVRVKVGALPAGISISWIVCSRIGNHQSEWVVGTPVTTWAPGTWDIFKNLVINGNMLINQRVTTIVDIEPELSWAYVVDRIEVAGSDLTDGDASQASFTDGRGWGISFYGLDSVTGSEAFLRTRIESENASYLKNRYASCSVKAHFVSIASTVTIDIYKADAQDDFSATTLIDTYSKSILADTDTWVKFENINMGDCSNGIEIVCSFEGDSWNNNQGIMWNLQLEQNEICTPFEDRLFEDELRLCQRYYNKSFPYATAPADHTHALGYAVMRTQASSTIHLFPRVNFPVVMRAAPTIVGFNLGATSADEIYDGTADASLPELISGTTPEGFNVAVDNSSVVADHTLAFHWTAEDPDL